MSLVTKAKNLTSQQFETNIRKNLHYLTDHIDPDEVLTLLMQEKVVTRFQVDKIKAAHTEYEKTERLLDKLTKRPVTDIPVIIRCFCDTNQGHIAKLMLGEDLAVVSGDQSGTVQQTEGNVKMAAMQVMQSGHTQITNMIREMDPSEFHITHSFQMFSFRTRSTERKDLRVRNTSGRTAVKSACLETTLSTKMDYHCTETSLLATPGSNDHTATLTLLQHDRFYEECRFSLLWVEALRANVAMVRSFVECNEIDTSLAACTDEDVVHATISISDTETVEVLIAKSIRRIVFESVQHTLHIAAIKGTRETLNALLQRLRCGEPYKLMNRCDRIGTDFYYKHHSNDRQQAQRDLDVQGASNVPESIRGNANTDVTIKVPEELIGDDAVMLEDSGGQATLLCAAMLSNTQTITLLVKDGLVSCPRVVGGLTPLHVASSYGSVTLVQDLIISGADVHAVSTYGYTVLHSAVDGADNPAIIRLLIATGIDVNVRDKYNRTPLCIAATAGNAKCIEQLIASGANLQAVNKEGLNALHYAAMFSGDRQTIKLLIEKGLDVNARNKEGSTPLHRAAQSGNIKAIQQLIAHSANLEAVNKCGNNALHLATLGTGDPETITLLIEKGLDVNARNKDNSTPLHMAARNGNMKAMELLIGHGADKDAIDKLGGNALHSASAGNGDHETIKLLIEKGVNPNKGNILCLTPLFYAKLFGNTKAVHELNAHGASSRTTFTLL